jgi:hypothetical protein
VQRCKESCKVETAPIAASDTVIGIWTHPGKDFAEGTPGMVALIEDGVIWMRGGSSAPCKPYRLSDGKARWLADEPHQTVALIGDGEPFIYQHSHHDHIEPATPENRAKYRLKPDSFPLTPRPPHPRDKQCATMRVPA